MARVVSGLASILGRLASYFRIGQTAHAEPGSQQPARSELHTPQEIVSELRARNELPTRVEGARWAWSYICYWIDPTTGERIGRGVAWTVETEAGASYQLASSEARRRTRNVGPDLAHYITSLPAGARLQCRRIGQPILIPTS